MNHTPKQAIYFSTPPSISEIPADAHENPPSISEIAPQSLQPHIETYKSGLCIYVVCTAYIRKPSELKVAETTEGHSPTVGVTTHVGTIETAVEARTVRTRTESRTSQASRTARPAEEFTRRHAILPTGSVHRFLQHLAHFESVEHVLQRHHAIAGRLIARIQHNRAHAEDALQECTFHADIHDAEQFDQVKVLVQNTGFDAQFLIGERVYGERERRTAPIAFTLPPQDIAACNLHMVSFFIRA